MSATLNCEMNHTRCNGRTTHGAVRKSHSGQSTHEYGRYHASMHHITHASAQAHTFPHTTSCTYACPTHTRQQTSIPTCTRSTPGFPWTYSARSHDATRRTQYRNTHRKSRMGHINGDLGHQRKDARSAWDTAPDAMMQFACESIFNRLGVHVPSAGDSSMSTTNSSLITREIAGLQKLREQIA